MLDKVKSECVPLFKEQWQTKVLLLVTVALFIITAFLAQKYADNMSKLLHGKASNFGREVYRESTVRDWQRNPSAIFKKWSIVELDQYQSNAKTYFAAFVSCGVFTILGCVASCLMYAKIKKHEEKQGELTPKCFKYRNLLLVLGLIFIIASIGMWIKVNKDIQALTNVDMKNAIYQKEKFLHNRFMHTFDRSDPLFFYEPYDEAFKTYLSEFGAVQPIYNWGVSAFFFTLMGTSLLFFGLINRRKKAPVDITQRYSINSDEEVRKIVRN